MKPRVPILNGHFDPLTSGETVHVARVTPAMGEAGG